METIDTFTLEKKRKPGRALFDAMNFREQGKTGDPLWIWSGDTLMDLTRFQALKMTLKRIEDDHYLFIEAGGFSTRKPPGWKPPYYVMQKTTQ